ncbi:GNAT family N-acetyltransferase [Streptomyces physcomitrii]|uniref:GNAT family N-acetyltransferase n=1 Tax=Streptomyces physcomitrii TaxID=2724184 RepID=A0ABX1GXH1_9ACTN|nr:GNAT family N-acetyltransferase [Streptomyces physcomitrii]NKI40772.1 GNAT family N-acetyltransferase [Streptomyces physcomitrii]
MVRIETAVDKARRALLHSRLREANTAASPALRALRDTPLDRENPLQLWALDDSGELIAGLDAHTWARWLHINLLWVHGGYRGAGLGSQLLAAAEEEARTGRDCRSSRVWTWDFQAPRFYRRCGYRVVCELPDYPEGVTEYTLVKQLRT